MAISRDVHIDAALSNLSIGYAPKGLIADKIMKTLSVVKESDKYYIWDRVDSLREVSTLKPDRAVANEMDFDFSTSTYSAENYALKGLLTDRTRDNADSPLQIRKTTMQQLLNKVLLGWELRVATLFTTLGNYATTNRTTLAGVNQWNNAAFSGSIEKDVDDGKEAVRQNTGGIEPNTIIIPAAVAKVIKRDDKVRSLIKDTHSDLLVNGDLPPTLWNMKVYMPTASYVSSNKGHATTSLADTWGKHVVMTYVPENGSIMTPAHAYTFRKGNPVVRTWRDEEYPGEFIEPNILQTEKITSNVSGYLLKDVIA